jgi:hypothetical protein
LGRSGEGEQQEMLPLGQPLEGIGECELEVCAGDIPGRLLSDPIELGLGHLNLMAGYGAPQTSLTRKRECLLDTDHLHRHFVSEARAPQRQVDDACHE